MELLQKNPFTTIKANDLNDQEINTQWVDIHKNGFLDLFCPTNKMGMYIFGGKGSGKTHLMRYFSYKAQMVRNSGRELEGIKADGYFGIYFQASGLQGSRFEHLPCAEEKRNAIYIYSFDLWLAGLFLDSIKSICSDTSTLFDDEVEFCKQVLALFNEIPENIGGIKTIGELKSFISDLSKKVDISVNNAFIDDDLNVEIRANRGALIFGLPKLMSKHSDLMRDVTFLYLVDELENVGANQQRYINTLLREKSLPVTFRIGARRHGIKTFETLGSGEVNKEGHEFEVIRLDSVFSDEKDYENFAIELIVNRLVASNMASNDLLGQSEGDNEKRKKYLEVFFENVDIDTVLKDGRVKKNTDSSLLMSSFKSRLTKLKAIKDPGEIVSKLSFPTDNVAELAAIHLFCQEWSKENISYEALLPLADRVREEIIKYANGESGRLSEKISYYKNNYVASALRAKNKNNLDQYLGLDNMLKLTKGFPRHILTVLRHIYKLEVFSGRAPFSNDGKISVKSQKLALKESSDWFHDDCVTEGKLGNNVAVSLQRLCEILRLEFYADKPAECSASSFTIQKNKLPENLKKVIDWAKLIRVIVPADQLRQEKNSQQVIEKYHINGLLCPRWGLPINRRGALELNLDFSSAIFDIDKTEEYLVFKSNFEKARYAPYQIVDNSEDEQATQPKLDF
jgi:hypothetical protein